MAAAVKARRYAIAGVCLLIAAAALRFYGISEYGLLYDEALAAVNSKGAFAEVIYNTREKNSSPILYPIALWAVQKVASTEFSVRLMPAVASALTVVALLFVMPRLGVPRRAAFLAALLAALSVAAIEHAQNSREYSVDALIAVLMIAGMLQYLRDGGKALLCAVLFVGPLLQYGLALFGVAVIGAAAVAPAAAAQTLVGGGRGMYGAGAVWGWLKGRIGLLLPIGAFGAACAASWALTLRYQWTPGGWNSYDGYLTAYYHQSGFDAAAIVGFAFSRTWSLLSYHMPLVIAAAALLAFGAWLALLLKRRRCDSIALLALFAVGVAMCAALMVAYPFGGIRQCLYLGPIVFMAAGGAFHSAAVEVSALLRRAWLAPALAAAAAVMVALIGAVAIRQDDSHSTANNAEQVFAALDELEQEGDAVYVYRWAIPSVEFYKGAKPDNYFYEQVPCPEALTGSWTVCFPEALAEMFRELNEARRIWLIHNTHVNVQQEIAAFQQEITVEEIDVAEIAALGWNALYLITGFEEAVADLRKEWRDMYDAVASDAPSVAADYNLYLRDNALYYAKQPCAPADTEDSFFLHIYPANAADLPAYGNVLENLDFDFINYGFLTDDKCIIRRALPEYPINRIHTGQFVYPDGAVVWDAEIWIDSTESG